MGKRSVTTFVVVAALTGVLLGSPSAIAAGRFVPVATHPQAKLQQTATGKILDTLQTWNGKIYSGYGDYTANTGPIALTPFDGNAFASTELNAGTEAISTFRVINGALYAPSTDPKPDPNPDFSNPDFAVGTSIGGVASWSNPRPVGSTHAFDIVSLTGSDLWIVGSDGYDAAAWRSLDGGTSWSEVLTVPEISGIFDDFARFYGAGVYQGKLYVQAKDYYGAVHPTSKVFDGTSWSDGPNLGTFNHAQDFAGKLVYHGGLHAGWSANYLKAFDGASSRIVLSSLVYDYTIDGPILYALGNDGWIRKSQDLVSWSKVARAPNTARSITVLNRSIYVGGTDSKLYRLR